MSMVVEAGRGSGGLSRIVRARAGRGGPLAAAKRAFDLAGALVLLIVVAPLLALAALAVKLSDGGPVLYRQRRVGLHGRRFTMLKLRTMAVGADRLAASLADRNLGDGLLFKIGDDPRVTGVGRILRRVGIDELPQLWNVVRGDMSLVGPRPLPVDPSAFGWRDGRRHDVRPGITGPWQTEVRGGYCYERMVALDLDYVARWSFRRDLALLARTLPAVGRRWRAGPC